MTKKRTFAVILAAILIHCSQSYGEIAVNEPNAACQLMREYADFAVVQRQEGLSQAEAAQYMLYTIKNAKPVTEADREPLRQLIDYVYQSVYKAPVDQLGEAAAAIENRCEEWLPVIAGPALDISMQCISHARLYHWLATERDKGVKRDALLTQYSEEKESLFNKQLETMSDDVFGRFSQLSPRELGRRYYHNCLNVLSEQLSATASQSDMSEKATHP